MRILHTADWHLGKRLDRFTRLDEQREVLEEIITKADDLQVDVVLIAGDLFDSFNPSSEAIELLYSSLKRLSKEGNRLVVAIAGNHDSPDRIDAPDVLARECGIVFAGYPHILVPSGIIGRGIHITKSQPGFLEARLPGYSYPLRLLITPYANEYRLKAFLGVNNQEEELRKILQIHWQDLVDSHCDDQGVNLLMAHLFVMKKGEIPPDEPADEKPILHIGGAQAIYSENIPSSLQYVALGHLHRYQEIDKERMPIVYSSSLLSYSFAEAGQEKYVVLLSLDPGEKAVLEKIKIESGKPLLRKRFEYMDEALEWLRANPQAWVELTMVSDDFMKTEDRRTLLQTHEGIVTIIPEIRQGKEQTYERTGIDLSQSIDELFIQYFLFRNGQLPNEELLTLFKEIKAEQTEE